MIPADLATGGAIRVITLGLDPLADSANLGELRDALTTALGAASGAALPELERVTIYGTGSDDPMVPFAPAIVAFFLYFFVYLLTGVSFLRERTGGTLERLMATPVTRGEVVGGYLLGFGLFATVQVAVLLTWALGSVHVPSIGPLPAFSLGLGIPVAGSPAVAFLVVVLLGLGAISLGIFLSTFARTELQVIQFIPVVLVPQFLLSGVLFPVTSLPAILQPLVAIMPLHYAVDALRLVFIQGADLTLRALQVDVARARRHRGAVRGRRLAHDPPGRRVSPGGRRTGRRPGSADTRGRILDAARAAFGERGYDGASVRQIAADAGRGPGARPPLLRPEAAAVRRRDDVPGRPGRGARRGSLADGPREELGERFVRFVVALWDRPDVRPLVAGVVRSATTDPVAATMARRLLTEGPLLAIATAIALPDARAPGGARERAADGPRDGALRDRGRAAGVDVAGGAGAARRPGDPALPRGRPGARGGGFARVGFGRADARPRSRGRAPRP